jgi:protein required for attachment to host cells
MKIERDAWVVLADGRKALFVQNIGTPLEPRLSVRDVIEAPPNPSTSEQGADRPGRSHDSTSPGRSAMEQTDWHDQAETRFAKTVVEAMTQLVDAKGDIILVAAPRALADIRAALPDAVRGRLVNEVNKDLTNHPLPEIEKILAKL